MSIGLVRTHSAPGERPDSAPSPSGQPTGSDVAAAGAAVNKVIATTMVRTRRIMAEMMPGM